MSYQNNKEMRTVTISIPQELVEKIDTIAIEEERSRSKMIEILLKKILYKNSPNLLKSNKILNLKNTIDLQKD
jgi:metal-responsive CopG/Arc/MetJ family transcriptional regulator|tara:strand:+ start:1647 stop:1865 length:219 start_codon:yes stop_codon:yes gene_type:complete